MNSSDQNANETTETTHRSRWQRFSPSMGWKAFWSEILIVILGVLIALAANEAVQDWSWRNKVQDGEVRLQGDVAYLFKLSAEQYSVKPCTLLQLQVLSQKLVHSSSAWTPVTVHIDDGSNVPFIIRMPARPHVFPVWDSLLADGTAARFPQDRQAFYGAVSARITRTQNQNDDANQLGRRLLALGHPMALSDDTRRYFLVMTEEIRALITGAELGSKQRMTAIAEFGSAPEAKQVEAYLKESRSVKFCKANGYPLADWRSYKTQ